MNDRMPQFDELAQALAKPDNQVSNGLNLTLELKDPRRMLLLLGAIALLRKQTDAALKELHFVHFARFLPTRDSRALLVITEYDGALQPYVMDFAASISQVFSAILSFVKDAPRLPVHEYPDEFWAFIEKNNKVLPCVDPWPLYSAYPEKTVLDILGPRTDLPPPYVDARPAPVHFADVQGNILRAYHRGANFARHFALQVLDQKEARLFLAAIVSGHPNATLPQISTAQPWTTPPDYFFNVAFTYEGLSALRVSSQDLACFPAVFREGPADPVRARKNGDVGTSAPLHWVLGGPGQLVHLFASLYADTRAELDTRTVQLRSSFAASRLHELFVHDAARMPDDAVHFGYKDGIGQPRIAGVHDATEDEDRQPLAGPGEFLTGANYRNIYGGMSIGKLPPALAENGSFVAVRVLGQDVDAFEAMLTTEAARNGIDRELVAAKLMGRWRNGDPLVLVRQQPRSFAVRTVAHPSSNHFDYAPTPAYPNTENDFYGSVCPVGSHIRRMNPRAAPVAGKPYTRRLMRRGMPYEVGVGGGKTEKGLFGLFICSDLERQFEFLQQTWANGDIAASGIRGTQDPIIGSQSLGGGFHAPGAAGAPLNFQLPRLVTTRGSVYLFMPGISGLRTLAGLQQEQGDGDPPQGQDGADGVKTNPNRPGGFDPDSFDPTDPAFHADPYPAYALFRQHAPVHKIQKYDNTYWVFTHALVTQMCEDSATFLKQPVGTDGPRGIFFMDPPRHMEVRNIINPVFAQAIASSDAMATQSVTSALAAVQARGAMELVADFAKCIPRDVFMAMFGIPPAQRRFADEMLDTMLHYYDRTLPAWKRLNALFASISLNVLLDALLAGCPAHAPAGLLCMMKEQGLAQGMSSREVSITSQNFALGGYLSTQFLLATGVYNLLRQQRKGWLLLQQQPQLLPNAIAEMLRFDAPFQMADRFAARDTTLGGVPIPAGAMVVAVYGSANRDAQVFTNPDTFDITRQPDQRSYGFGHGEHRCIGAPLVDIVAPIALRQLMATLPGLQLGTEEPVWLSDPYFRSFDHLPLAL